ncbi:TEA domain-containing protein [Mycena kentingensis (nom. inval.)]|nr:TEA domain-containing protein [Mycena kentingensis (nom. inval.)]
MYWPSSTPTPAGSAPTTPQSMYSASQPHSPAQANFCTSASSSSGSSSSYPASRSVSPAARPQNQTPKTKDDNERQALSALQDAHTGDVLRSVLRVRKTWKSDRTGSTVWPLELEAALLEGLEQYVPDDSRETRMLGRFPRRNRFISDYIFDKTGQRRTPKQVGSRLQQLRESCGGQRLLHLLSPFREPPPSPTSTADSSLNSPTLTAAFAGQAPPHTEVYIDLVNENRGCASPPDSPSLVSVSEPRRIAQINSLCTFSSAAPLSAHARFTVFSVSTGQIVHTEAVPLELRADVDAPGYYYSARLVPNYWSVIVESPDPTRFTIFQEIVKDDSFAPMLFTATYRFRYPIVASHYATGSSSPTVAMGLLPDQGAFGYGPAHGEPSYRPTAGLNFNGWPAGM